VGQEFVERYKKECQRRLDDLKAIVQNRNPPISGLDVEKLLAWLAKKAGVREDIFNGYASYIEWTFSAKNLVVMYGLLSYIEEDIQWAGVDWGYIFSGRPEE
jgi:hypothetical protein